MCPRPPNKKGKPPACPSRDRPIMLSRTAFFSQMLHHRQSPPSRAGRWKTESRRAKGKQIEHGLHPAYLRVLCDSAFRVGIFNAETQKTRRSERGERPLRGRFHVLGLPRHHFLVAPGLRVPGGLKNLQPQTKQPPRKKPADAAPFRGVCMISQRNAPCPP